MIFVLFLLPHFFVSYEVFFESSNTIADGVLVDNNHASYRSRLSMPQLHLDTHHTLSSLICSLQCQESEGGPTCNTLVSGNVRY